MLKFAKFAGIAAAVGLSASLVAPARGALEIQYSLDGGPLMTAATAASGSQAGYSATIGGVVRVMGVNVTSDSPGEVSADGSAMSELLSAALSLKNVDTAGGTHTVEFVLGDTGFTEPLAPPVVTIDSQVGGSVTAGSAANALSFSSFVDTLNRQNSTGVGTVEAGPGTPAITATGSAFSADSSAVDPLLTGPYSVTEDLVVTLGKGGQINLAGSTVLTTAVPEPASVGLVGAALIGLGLRRSRRRA